MGKRPKSKRHSKEDILSAGLNILAQHGENALTIDTICKKLNVTKGSFYHHFASRDNYSRQLLQHWEEEYTRRFIAMCDQNGSPEEKYCTLDALALELDDDVEVAIRAWALRDPMAHEFQERIDATRMNYLHTLYKGMLQDTKSAELFAQLEYALFIGIRQMTPRPDTQRMNELIVQWTTILKHFLKGEIA